MQPTGRIDQSGRYRAKHAEQLRYRHGGEPCVVPLLAAVRKTQPLGNMIDLHDLTIEFEVVSDIREEALVKAAGATVEWVLELVVGTPAQLVALEDHVGKHALQVDRADPFGDPVLAHHL